MSEKIRAINDIMGKDLNTMAEELVGLRKNNINLRDQLHSALVLLKAVDYGNGTKQTEQWQASFRDWSDRNFPADKEVDNG